MTTICISPIKQSLAQPSKYQLVFSRIANTVYYCTATQIPGISVPEQTQATPFVNLPLPGNKLVFDPFKFTFMIDSNYNSWVDMYKWLTGVGFPENFDQYKNMASNVTRPGLPPPIGVRPPYSDAILTIYTNKNNPQVRITFKDCFPISLSGLPLGYNLTAEHPIFAEASFRYSYYTVEKIA